jgi:hypothetical protein
MNYTLSTSDHNLFHLFKCDNKNNYKRLIQMNKKQLTGNAKNRRQYEINDVLLSFYDIIDKEFHYFKEASNNNNNSHFNSIFKHKLENIRTTSDKSLTSNLVSILENIPYIPSSIVTYIKEKFTYVLTYSFRIDESRTAKVNFIIFEESVYEINNIKKKSASYFKNAVLKIYLWLKVASKYAAKKCAPVLECFIYLTPFKRSHPIFSKQADMTPTTKETAYEDYEEYEDLYHHMSTPRISSVLKPIHINGGVSDLCQPSGRVIVYRKEEWFKVFIHETMHNYGLDFSEMDINGANALLHKMFTIQKNVKLYESYCEIWARIMNIVFETYFDINSRAKFSSRTTRKNFIDNLKLNENKGGEYGASSSSSTSELNEVSIKNAQNRRKFIRHFYNYLQYESLFSLFQNIKILNYMGLDYNIITNCTDSNYIVAKKLYKEETNAFAYYVIVSILLSNFNNFILWCIDNNTNIIQFNKNKNNITSFVQFIYKNYKRSELMNIVMDLEIRLESMDTNLTSEPQNMYDNDTNNDTNNGTSKDNEMLKTMRMTIVGGYS